MCNEFMFISKFESQIRPSDLIEITEAMIEVSSVHSPLYAVAHLLDRDVGTMYHNAPTSSAAWIRVTLQHYRPISLILITNRASDMSRIVERILGTTVHVQIKDRKTGECETFFGDLRADNTHQNLTVLCNGVVGDVIMFRDDVVAPLDTGNVVVNIAEIFVFQMTPIFGM